MKILHTADWHLGKILHNTDLLKDQDYILKQLIEIIIREKPDVILIAGDIYERSLPAADAVQLFDKVVSDIILTHKIPIIAIAGNHDNPERVAYCNSILQKQGLYIFGTIDTALQPIVLSDQYGEVYFYPIPYTEPEVLTSLLQYTENPASIHSHQEVMNWVTSEIRKKHDLATDRVVLILHAFVAGGQASESERNLYLGQAGYVQADTFQDFDYVALGHLHIPQDFLNQKVRYAGSLLKYSLSEVQQDKSVCIVEIGAKGHLKLNTVSLKPLRDLHKVRGRINNGKFVLTEDDIAHIKKEDYLHVILQETHHIGNLMNIIQKEYPNTISLEFENNANKPLHVGLSLNKLQEMDEIKLFELFYQKFSQNQNTLSEEQKKLLQKVLKEIHEQPSS